MTINSKALVASGVEIGQAVFMEEAQPVDLEFFGRRYLQSGYVETDTNLFDTDIFTAKRLTSPTAQTSSFGSSEIYDAAYGDGVYVMVGTSGKIANSDDAVTWVQRSSGFGTDIVRGVAFGAGLFVAVSQTNIIQTSTDGTTWTTRASGLAGGVFLGVSFVGGLFIATATNGELVTSPDGISWTSRASGFGVSGIYDAAYGDGVYVIVGASGKVANSTDAVSWTLQTSNYGTGTIRAVAYGSGTFVAVGNTLNTVTRSEDGVTWVKTAESMGGKINNDLSSDGTAFLLTASDGVARYNETGTGDNWETISSLTASTLNTCIFMVGTSLVGGNSGVLTTYDYANIAGSQTAHAENGENQYIRIS